jgi:hypothetical protein
MGRSGIRRRKKPRHLAKLGGGDPRRIGVTPQPSGWTVEGQIEAVGQTGRALRDGSPAQNRYFGRLAAITIAALVVIGAVAWLIGR